MSTTELTPSPLPQPRPPVTRMGEELPIFCEKCGYCLYGLPSRRCEHCDILHFQCPECGHHQPINTLRPAFQRILGRMRAWVVGFGVLFRIFCLWWMFFAWGAMGYEGTYRYRYEDSPVAMRGMGRYYYNTMTTLEPRPLTLSTVILTIIFGMVFGMFARMLLLRWRRGLAVGGIVAGLVVVAVIIGSALRQADRGRYEQIPSFWTKDYLTLLMLSAAVTVLGAILVWPIWSGLARLFLPRRIADALLAWQQFYPDTPSRLARE